MVKVNVEGFEIIVMFLPYACDQLLGCDALFFCAQHDGCAVRIVGANIVASMALHFLKTYPYVCLDVLNQMAQMNAAVGVGQGRSN